MAAICNLLGPLLVGAAVADTIGGIVTVERSSRASRSSEPACWRRSLWNLATWRARAAVELGSRARRRAGRRRAWRPAGADAVRWGGFDGMAPVGVHRHARRARGGAVARRHRRVARDPRAAPARAPGDAPLARAGARGPVGHVGGTGVQPWRQRRAEGGGRRRRSARSPTGGLDALSEPLWATVACAAALTTGTALGGWSIVKTIGRRIYRIHPIDASHRRRHPPASSSARRSRRPGLDDAGGRLVGRRRRRRSPPLAARPLGARASHRARMARHVARDRRCSAPAPSPSGGGSDGAPALAAARHSRTCSACCASS